MATPKATGSFIQSYLAATYSDTKWAALFAALAQAEITQLIFQGSYVGVGDAQNPTFEPTQQYAFYPSAQPHVILSGKATGAARWPLESVLYYAKQHGMKVFVGLNSYDNAWKLGSYTSRPFVQNAAWCVENARLGAVVADELHQLYGTTYSGTFAGWYWGWEVDNTPVFAKAATQANVEQMLNTHLEHVKGIGLPTMLSPFFTPNAELMSASLYAGLWSTIFSRLNSHAHGLILTPQDGVGDGNPIGDMAEWYSALKGAVAGFAGAKLWANCETYQPNPATQKYVPAPFSRVEQQLQAVAPYVDDIVTFAYCHYDSPVEGFNAQHQAWVAYVQSLHVE